ncbi:uncharacterized protein ASCRUDRAFT_10443 [Ascoidea rubescens DSM 1968]|uniref:GDP-mannose transporter n=1 Tax=Ascoidea rubescens DSM 1968 TaxID=1344418 RepID=A0A1D2V947_9ASCO|nr:hypothetical protein ASCRUDRAFT_10443 [Ascoidea rubescens DSM 1968]ODV58182.1 hypothetical protein ASCRUDRAFT_10443 [Ascoidea rubescens DSM 1968]
MASSLNYDRGLYDVDHLKNPFLDANLLDDNSSNRNLIIKSWSSYNKSSRDILFYVFGWYFLALTISLYKKWLFSNPSLNLSYPFIIASFNYFILFIISLLVLLFSSSLRSSIRKNINQIQLINNDFDVIDNIPNLNSNSNSNSNSNLNSNLNPNFNPNFDFNLNSNNNNNNYLQFKFKDYFMEPKLYLLTILPCAIAAGIDMTSANYSLKFLPLNSITVINLSSFTIFLLFFGILFHLEIFSFTIINIVIIITIGLIFLLTGNHSNIPSSISIFSSHKQIGYVLILTSSFFSAFKYSLIHLLLTRNKFTFNPVAMIFYLSPAVSTILFFLSILIESNINDFINNDIWTQRGKFTVFFLLSIPGILSFFILVCQFNLLKKTHLITFSVFGIIRIILKYLASVIIFEDSFSLNNFFGLIVLICSIIWFNHFRYIQSFQNIENFRQSDIEFQNYFHNLRVN